MSTKHISFEIGNVNDHVNYIGDTAYDCTVQALADDTENDFYLTLNDNGQTDLAIEVEDTELDWAAEFVEYGTNLTYNVMSNDFIGGRPVKRCPKCLPLS